MSRNKKADDAIKSMMIRVRVTPEEHDRFFKLAASRGYSSISDLIRSLLAENPEERQQSRQ